MAAAWRRCCPGSAHRRCPSAKYDDEEARPARQQRVPVALRLRRPSEVTMIRGMHVMFYSSEAAALRTFLKDKLELSSTDIADGWAVASSAG